MTWIPGIFITILTFPGFVMLTVARKFWCDLLAVPVYEAHYFKGTLIHEKIDSPVRAAFVVFAPFCVNTVLCAVLLFPGTFPQLLGSDLPDPKALYLVLNWAGISIGMHALPTRATINDYLESLPEHRRRGWVYSILRVTGSFFILIDFLKRFGLGFVYAVAVGVAVPMLITRIFMAL
jgi:hypothetical protein